MLTEKKNDQGNKHFIPLTRVPRNINMPRQTYPIFGEVDPQ